MALDTINPDRGVAALTDEQLHTLVDRLIANDPAALTVARRLGRPPTHDTCRGRRLRRTRPRGRREHVPLSADTKGNESETKRGAARTVEEERMSPPRPLLPPGVRGSRTVCAVANGRRKETAEMVRRTLTSTLYRAARLSATGRAIRTGHAGRRAKDLIVGRALGRAGLFRRLWR
jgi:hypothetical protein